MVSSVSLLIVIFLFFVAVYEQACRTVTEQQCSTVLEHQCQAELDNFFLELDKQNKIKSLRDKYS